MKRFPWNGAAILLLTAAVAGCSSLETSITRPDEQPTTMELRVEVPQSDEASSSAAPGPSLNVQIDDGDNVLNITGATIVVREMAFRRQEGDGCVDADGSGEPDEDSCAEIIIDPDVIDLPVDQPSISSGALVVEPGTYDALVFELYETRQEDLNVIDQRPDLLGSSVGVAGSFGGTSLGDSAVFNPTAEIVLPLEDPIELSEGASSGMTLTVDVASWFWDGDTLINPSADQDSAMRAEVGQRILESLSIEAGA